MADWYEKHKDYLEYDIREYILHWGKQQKSEFYEWMNHANNKPFQTLANMHKFGYEVEKEKRYIVKLKNVSDIFGILNFSKLSKEWRFSDSNTNDTHVIEHTHKELEKAGFGWVLDCPGIELEEVKK